MRGIHFVTDENGKTGRDEAFPMNDARACHSRESDPGCHSRESGNDREILCPYELIIYDCTMRGIHFVTDENGKKIAVQISLDVWGELWEDIYDMLVSGSRKNEPTVPWENLK